MKIATLCLIVLAAIGCSHKQDLGLPEIDLDLPKLDAGAKKFSSCTEMVNWRAQKSAQWNHYMNLLYASEFPIPALAAAAGTVTNVQERGVDEPDIVKTDDRSIFVARAQSVEVIDASDFKLRQTLALGPVSKPGLFVDGGRLFVLANFTHGTVPSADGFIPPGPRASEAFTLRSYVRDGRGDFRLETDQTFAGRIFGARLQNGRITLVSTESIPFASALATADGRFHGIACTDIQRPLMDDFNESLTSIRSIPTSTPARIQSTAQYGRIERMYMNAAGHLYLSATGLDWFFWDPRLQNSDRHYEDLRISKFDVRGAPEYSAAGVIQGRTRNSFAFYEMPREDLLYAATTVSTPFGMSNRLWAIDQDGVNLKIAGLTQDFAANEDIRSVRFFGDKAYVVTFEKTDPLYVIDLSTPRTPRMMSELVVPGFSAYLHPLTGGKWLGIGYGAVPEDGFSWLAGVQVSLFDIHDPSRPVAMDQQNFGGRFSHADAGVDHHALYVNEDANLAALPVRLLKSANTGDPWDISTELEFSGALLMNLNSPMRVTAKVSHYDWLPTDCRRSQALGGWWNYAPPTLDVGRVVQVGNNLVSISPFGIKVHDITDGFATTREIEFAKANEECRRQLAGQYLPN